MSTQFRARIVLDESQILSVGISFAAPLVAKVTRKSLNRGEVLSPVDKGIMRGSHSMSMRVRRTYVAGRVTVGAKYAEMVHNGTPPHTIQAKRAKALSFKWAKVGGVRVVVPKGGAKGPTGLRKGKKGVTFVITKGFVRHPGTRSRPWLYRALREVATLEGFKVTKTYIPTPGRRL